MTGLFKFGWFSSHSGFQLPWKLDADALDEGDWAEVAKLVAWKFPFSWAYGVPRGGDAFAEALMPHAEPTSGYPILVVDDVLTTGRSMNQKRGQLLECGCRPEGIIGVVLVSRSPKGDGGSIGCPNWVWPILNVNEWAQSRATGLG